MRKITHDSITQREPLLIYFAYSWGISFSFSFPFFGIRIEFFLILSAFSVFEAARSSSNLILYLVVSEGRI